MKKLIVATGNPGKVQEFQAYLQDLNWELQLKPSEIEIEETGTTFMENACLKASQVAKLTGEYTIADDSGLAVEALEGAPGLYSARYGKSDSDRIQRVLEELSSNSNRKAEFVCAIAIAQPNGEIALQAEGICPGEILIVPRGEGGFGYDPIFYVPEAQQTFAEMPPQVKHTLSHRGRAFDLLLPQLQSLH